MVARPWRGRPVPGADGSRCLHGLRGTGRLPGRLRRSRTVGTWSRAQRATFSGLPSLPGSDTTNPLRGAVTASQGVRLVCDTCLSVRGTCLRVRDVPTSPSPQRSWTGGHLGVVQSVDMTSSAEYVTGWGRDLSSRASLAGSAVSEERKPHAVRSGGPRELSECGEPVHEITGSWPPSGLPIWPCPDCLARMA